MTAPAAGTLGPAQVEDAFKSLLRAESDRSDRQFLSAAASQWRFWAYHSGGGGRGGFAGFALKTGGRVVSLHGYHLNARKRGRWGRYVVAHHAYTARDHRRQGLARALFWHAQAVWTAAGAHRMKSLAGSLLGALLHRGMGHTAWGLDSGGHLVIDHPLTTAYALDGVPPNVVQCVPDAYGPLPWDEALAAFRARGRGRFCPQP